MALPSKGVRWRCPYGPSQLSPEGPASLARRGSCPAIAELHLGRAPPSASTPTPCWQGLQRAIHARPERILARLQRAAKHRLPPLPCSHPTTFMGEPKALGQLSESLEAHGLIVYARAGVDPIAKATDGQWKPSS